MESENSIGSFRVRLEKFRFWSHSRETNATVDYLSTVNLNTATNMKRSEKIEFSFWKPRKA